LKNKRNEISYDDASCASYDDAYCFYGCFYVGKTLPTLMMKKKNYTFSSYDDDVSADGHSPVKMMTNAHLSLSCGHLCFLTSYSFFYHDDDARRNHGA
jgi:hypothetical protein